MTTECVPEQGLSVWSRGALPIVTPPPEIGTLNAEGSFAALTAARREQASIVVDMTATEFCDSGGISALAGAVRAPRPPGGELRLVVGGLSARKVLAITGMDGVCVMPRGGQLYLYREWSMPWSKTFPHRCLLGCPGAARAPLGIRNKVRMRADSSLTRPGQPSPGLAIACLLISSRRTLVASGHGT